MRRMLLFAVMVALAAANLAHPLLHAFEGGALDVALPYLDLLAMQLGMHPDLT